MTDLALVKIGGSIATTEDAPDRVNRTLLRRLAEEFAASGRKLVLVHGTGHVGKPWAHRGGFALTGFLGPRERSVALEIKSELRLLNQRVVATLLAAGLPTLGVDFEALTRRRGETAFEFSDEARLQGWLADGTIPVFYGDMLREPDGSYRVVSSDVMMVTLARTLRPRTALFLSNVDGVLDAADVAIPALSPAAAERVARRASDEQDVSAGMRGKLRHAFALAEITPEVWIANGTRDGIARELLAGRPALGTNIRATP